MLQSSDFILRNMFILRQCEQKLSLSVRSDCRLERRERAGETLCVKSLMNTLYILETEITT